MILLQFPGIKGETTKGDYKECILLNSCEFAIGRCATNVISSGSQRTIGNKKCDPIYVGKPVNPTTRQIMSASMGAKIGEAKIFFLETNNRCYLQLTLTDCLINEIKLSWHGTEQGYETFYLTFTGIEFRDIPAIGAGYPSGSSLNLLTNQGC